MGLNILTIGGQSFSPNENKIKNFQVSKDIYESFIDIYGYKPDLEDIARKKNISNSESLYLLLCNSAYYSKKLKQNNILPDLIICYSIGFLISFLHSEILDLKNLSKFIFERGLLMSNYGKKINAGMAAISGLDLKTLNGVLAKGFYNLHISNINGLKNISISGLNEELRNLEIFLKENFKNSCRFTWIDVEGPWHCQLLNPLSAEILVLIKKYFVVERKPLHPIMSTHSGRILKNYEDIIDDILPNMLLGVNWPLIMTCVSEYFHGRTISAYELSNFSFTKRLITLSSNNIEFIN